MLRGLGLVHLALLAAELDDCTSSVVRGMLELAPRCGWRRRPPRSSPLVSASPPPRGCCRCAGSRPGPERCSTDLAPRSAGARASATAGLTTRSRHRRRVSPGRSRPRSRGCRCGRRLRLKRVADVAQHLVAHQARDLAQVEPVLEGLVAVEGDARLGVTRPHGSCGCRPDPGWRRARRGTTSRAIAASSSWRS